ncbi:DUF4143 domain-containing protein, partial [Sphingobium sp. IP1]|uniref:DUF4143 domain-containing protein n=1 Tax=Sphingobium sp. IP1 TaxID=2021637 RepID=UPI001179F97B
GHEEALLGHPVAGGSWEGFVIESLIAAAPDGSAANFYRTAAGAEIDLVMTMPGGAIWVYEIKRSLSPKLERGFHHACEDLKPARRTVIYAGTEAYPLSQDIMVMSLREAAQILRGAAQS